MGTAMNIQGLPEPYPSSHLFNSVITPPTMFPPPYMQCPPQFRENAQPPLILLNTTQPNALAPISSHSSSSISPLVRELISDCKIYDELLQPPSIQMNDQYLLFPHLKLSNDDSKAKVYVGLDTTTGKGVAIKIFVRESYLYWSELHYLQVIENHVQCGEFVIHKLGDLHWNPANEKEIQLLAEGEPLALNPPFYCLVLELGACNLSQRIRNNQSYTTQEVYHIVAQLFDGLRHLHQIGLIHGSLNPDHALFSQSNYGKVKLCDFANSLRVNETNRENSFSEDLFDLPQTKSSDIWAMGAMIYRLYIGTPCLFGHTPTARLACMFVQLGKPDKRFLSTIPGPKRREFFYKKRTSYQVKKSIKDAMNSLKTSLLYPITHPSSSWSLQCDFRLESEGTHVESLQERLKQVMLCCFKYDPNARPTASQVVNFLSQPFDSSTPTHA